MRQEFFKGEHANTAFVLLDTKKCEACWNRLDVCSKNVVDRINFPWHKHIRFVNGGACRGCMKCVEICKIGAVSKLNKE